MNDVGRWAAVVLTLAALGGCGEGYVVKPAILNVTGITGESKVELLTVVSGFFKKEGFEDLGRYDAMISTVNHN